jgi:hypothetical protein
VLELDYYTETSPFGLGIAGRLIVTRRGELVFYAVSGWPEAGSLVPELDRLGVVLSTAQALCDEWDGQYCRHRLHALRASVDGESAVVMPGEVQRIGDLTFQGHFFEKLPTSAPNCESKGWLRSAGFVHAQ